MNRMILIVCLFAAVLILSLSRCLSSRNFRRIQRLCRVCTDTGLLTAEDSTFDAVLEQFGQMATDLSDSTYNKELLLIQARMSALQNQINPHFLYNTLEVIRSYALMHDCSEVAEMTEALSTMFRYNIGKPDGMTTLAEELENVDNYFLIQRYRFGDKFSLTIENEEMEELSEYMLPRLSLQPLVENAIHHGLEGKMGKGEIHIRIFRTQQELQIRIRDNGVGMDRETLLRLRQRLESGTELYITPGNKRHSGIAIVNLNQRYKLAFGPDYGVQVSSIEGTGTFFTLSLPLITRSEWEQKNEVTAS